MSCQFVQLKENRRKFTFLWQEHVKWTKCEVPYLSHTVVPQVYLADQSCCKVVTKIFSFSFTPPPRFLAAILIDYSRIN